MKLSGGFGMPLSTDSVWVVFVLIAASLYLCGLDSSYAPTNGDEMVYIHIARMTAESGHWLPLQSELENMRNTKPPLLIWQAMVAGGWGQHWSLWALRLPSIAYTFATTALLAFFAFQINRQGRALRAACVAASLYLLFFSTFRYGRVYLTSAPETFWLALPIWWVLAGVVKPKISGTHGPLTYTLFGVAMGVGTAYKSFALLAPAAASLWLALLVARPPTWRTAWSSAMGVAWSTLLGLGIFSLWFALDPDPAAVWNEFVLAENAGKLQSTMGYWQAAISGPYPMWTQLFAFPANGGLLVLPVGGFCLLAIWRAWQRWRTAATPLEPTHRVLLVWALMWLIIFAIPNQRSERYVIPAMPAIAIGMALVWDRLPRIWFWLTLLIATPVLIMLGRISWVMGELGMASNAEVAMTLFASCAGLACVAAGFGRKSWAGNACLAVVLSVYATFTLMVQPISGPEAGYSADVQSALRGKRVAVPNGFTGQFERYHFLLSGAQITPYDAEGRNTGALYPDMPPAARQSRLLAEFDAVVWLQEDLHDRPSCLPDCELLGQRWHIKSRHKEGEVTLDNLWQVEDWLFRREWLLSAKP
jgi:4-amino-4-deoxy-L-arabinose transferase-like glycosyltransferase